jgi:PAS domain S-box-containing protein
MANRDPRVVPPSTSSTESFRDSAVSSSLKIPLIYLLVGILWIVGSDQVIHVLVPDFTTFAWLQTLKGWFFIAVTTLLLHWLIRRDQRTLKRSHIALRHSLQERIETEQSLRESQERFMLAVSGTNDGIWDWDLRTNQVYYSPVWLSILGYDKDELPAVLETWLENTHIDDRAEALQAVQDHLTGKTEIYQSIHRMKHKSDRWIWVSAKGRCARDQSGEAYRFTGTITDITDRKQAEEALRSQQELLQTILDHIPVMIAFFDAQGNYRWVNREWERILGWQLEEVRSYDLLAELYPDPAYRQQVIHFIQSATHTWADFRTQLRNGQVLDTAWANVRLSDGSNIGIGQDITDRKRTETALQAQAQREQLLRTIAQRIHQSLNLQDILNAAVTGAQHLLRADRVVAYQFADNLSGQIVAESVTTGWRVTLGCTFADNCFQAGKAEAYRQGRKWAIANIYEAGLSLCHINQLEQFEVKANLVVPILLNKNGTGTPRLWGLLSAQQCANPREWATAEIELLDQLSVQLAIAIQQSELYQQVQQLNTNLEHQIEERTAQLQQTLNFEAILRRISDKVRNSLDEDQILQTVVQEVAGGVEQLHSCDIALFDFEQNQVTIAYESMTAITAFRGDLAPLENFADILPQEQQGQPLQFCEIVPKVVSSDWEPLAILSYPILDNQGLLGDIWLFRSADSHYSESEIFFLQQVASQCAIAIRQARLYQTAQAQVQKLQQLNSIKDDFLSTVSHELRTPIANMKMAIHLLKLAPTPDRQQQYLDILTAECNRESALINDLLDLQRLDAQRYVLQLDLITLQEWLPEVVDPFLSRAHDRQQQVEIEIDPDLAPLRCDRNSLGRILAELLNNACKYTGSGGAIRLTVSPSATPASSGAIATKFEVANQTEIAPAELPRIFEKFYRIPHSDTWNQGGTGLGLALVQKLVEQLQGAIEVNSQNGWTTFTLTLMDLQLPQ